MTLKNSLIILVIFLSSIVTAYEWNDDYKPQVNLLTGNKLHLIQLNETFASLSELYFNTTLHWFDIFMSNGHYFYNQDVKMNTALPEGLTFEIPSLKTAEEATTAEEKQEGEDTAEKQEKEEEEEEGRLLADVSLGSLSDEELSVFNRKLTSESLDFWSQLWKLSETFDQGSRVINFMFENQSPYILRDWACSCQGSQVDKPSPQCPNWIRPKQVFSFSLAQLNTSENIKISPFCVFTAKIQGLSKTLQFGVLLSMKELNNVLSFGYDDPASPKPLNISVSNYKANPNGFEIVNSAWRDNSYVKTIQGPFSNFVFNDLPQDFYGMSLGAFVPNSKVGTMKMVFFMSTQALEEPQRTWFMYTRPDKTMKLSCTTTGCTSVPKATQTGATKIRLQSKFSTIFALVQDAKYIGSSSNRDVSLKSAVTSTSIPVFEERWNVLECDNGSYQLSQGHFILTNVTETHWKLVTTYDACTSGLIYLSDS